MWHPFPRSLNFKKKKKARWIIALLVEYDFVC